MRRLQVKEKKRREVQVFVISSRNILIRKKKGMSRKLLYTLITVLVLALLVAPAAAQEKVVITWFVGLGSGTQDQQIANENKVVDDFNKSQDKIELKINIAASFETATDTFSTLVAAGTPPDIVGPIGVGGSNSYADQWLDLKPLIEKNKYDLSGFDPALLSLYETNNGGWSAIPFAIYPSVTYFNRDLFDEAGLKYPPQKFGEKYTMPDGTEVEWNYDTLAQVAKLLTVDKNGNDATSADFDPNNITQFGLNFQWALMRLILTDLQPAKFYDASTNKIALPEDWRKGAQWVWDGVWKSHFIPNTTYSGSDAFGTGNVFQSGKLGMAIVPLWYTCCLADSVGKFKWDFGVVPQSFDGKYHVAMDADTFRITKGSAHPDEAFTVLSYLLDQAVPTLAPTYGAFPARKEYQQAWIDSKNQQYNWGVNWQVAIDSIPNVNPSDLHHESFTPNNQKVQDRFAAFYTQLFGDTGKDMDLNKELDKLQSDLQAIVDEKGTQATPEATASS
jgi:multiple sugar transport system substrate-binding protein